MYHWIDDKKFISNMRQLCGDIMQDLCHTLAQDYDISSHFYMVGSGARNLILQNNNQPIDLDYNLEIDSCSDFNDCRSIKEKVRNAFNKVLNNHGWSDCDDSTSSLTTEKRHFVKGDSTEFSIDVAIVASNNKGYYRLIHEKTGFSYYDRYFWNEAPNSNNLKNKVKFIKDKHYWNDAREEYLELKNMYLSRNDHNHPSFICYLEAVNNVYNRLRNKR